MNLARTENVLWLVCTVRMRSPEIAFPCLPSPPPPQFRAKKGRTCHVVVSDQEVGTGTSVDQGEEFRGGKQGKKR